MILVDGKKVSHVLVEASGEHGNCIGVEEGCSEHRGQGIEVGVLVRRDDLHRGLSSLWNACSTTHLYTRGERRIPQNHHTVPIGQKGSPVE